MKLKPKGGLKEITIAVSKYRLKLKTIPKFKPTVKHLTIRSCDWSVNWLHFYSGMYFMAQLEIEIWMLLEMAQHNFMNATVFRDWLPLAEFMLFVRDQSYRPSKLTATYTGSTSGAYDSDPLPATWILPITDWSWKTNGIHEIVLRHFQKDPKNLNFRHENSSAVRKLVNQNISTEAWCEQMLNDTVVNFGIVSSSMLQCDTTSFIFQNHNLEFSKFFWGNFLRFSVTDCSRVNTVHALHAWDRSRRS